MLCIRRIWNGNLGEPTGNQPGTQRNTWVIIGESRGNHGGNIGESYGKLVKHHQPSHQHSQQAILGDGLRSAVTAFQSAVQNLPREVDFKTWGGSSMHIVRLTMRHHLFLEFWLVGTWYFAHWRHHRDVTRLENVRQSSIRRGKKLGFQLSHKHPLWFEAVEGPKRRINLFK